MNNWNAYPFIRYSLALIAGILLSQYFPHLWAEWELSGAFLFLFYLVTVLLFRKAHLQLFRVLSGIVGLLLFVLLGGGISLLSDQRKSEHHFTHFQEDVEVFAGTIVSDHSERERFVRYEFRVQSVVIDTGVQETNGLIHLYVKKDTSWQVLPYGTKLWVKSRIATIEGPKNPEEFDYRQYLERKNIYGQSFVAEEKIRIVGLVPENPVLAFAYQVRSGAGDLIREVVPGHQEAAVLSALLVGIKDHLDNEIRSAYSESGAMHVLAVSGLHVGIIYLLVVMVLGPLKRIRWGKLIFVAGSLVIIWSYAMVTGFSPSVMRAATMFSIIVLGENSGRKSNIYNSLGIAAFVLLLYNPRFVFDVGFQLSFSAVFGIVMLQPPLFQLWEPPNVILKYLWGITCVSIAAQIATFPISIHYFHQFPSYFLFSNLVVIPAAMVMLTSGLFMLMVGSFSLQAGEVVGFLVGTFVEWVNKGIILIQDLPMSTTSWLNFTLAEVVLIYLFLIYLFTGLSGTNFQKTAFGLLSVTAFFFIQTQVKYQQSYQEKLVIYQVDDHLAIDLIEGKKATLLLDHLDSSLVENLRFRINPHRLSAGLPPLEQTIVFLDQYPRVKSMDGLSLLTWNHQKILIISDSSTIQFDEPVEADVLITRSTDLALISKVKFKNLIVADIDTYYKQKSMMDSLRQAGIRFHSLEGDGFFMIEKRESGS